MGLSGRAARLRGTAPFSALADHDLERLAAVADEVCVPAGFLLVDEDDGDDHLFVIARGTATAFSDDGVVRTLGAGAVIGEVTPSAPESRRRTIVASTPVRLFVFDVDGVAKLAAEHPELIPPWGAAPADSRHRSSRRPTEG
jgi:CRP-like cAMP-binding protein